MATRSAIAAVMIPGSPAIAERRGKTVMTQHYQIEKAAEYLLAHRRPLGIEAQCLPQLAFVCRHPALS